jgi:hypothetical protein
MANLHNYCNENGFFFDDDCLFNFHCSLQSKPFVILYGPSGTGKSKIAEMYAAHVCSHQNINIEDHLCFIPVRPNWTSPTDIMGFYDYINDKFIESELYQFMVKAISSPEKPYFLILDEMNLSVVEHYFSDFLACLESRRIHKNNISEWENILRSMDSSIDKITLSHAIIISFYKLVENNTIKENEPFNFSIIREDNVVLNWKERNFHGQEDSWFPMFRTEFNQKDEDGKNSRLAGKFFGATQNVKGEYKKREDIDINIEIKLKNMYENYKKIEKNSISQHEITVYKTSKEIKKIPIPLNLYIIGTINMDESTHALSPKVLDRANIIEMNNISRRILSDKNNEKIGLKTSKIECNFSEIKNISSIESAKELNNNRRDIVDLIYNINDKLIPFRTNLGHRSIFEISHYILNYIKILGDEYAFEALDWQLSQKLIPKLMGADERIEISIIKCLEELLNIEINNFEDVISNEYTSNFPKTVDKLIRMYKYFTVNGYVNFTNV